MAPVVAGRYRLDALLRPDADPSAWRATDLSTARPVLVCLVSEEMGSAAARRCHLRHAGLLPVSAVVRMRDSVIPPLGDADPRGATFVVLDPLEGDPLEDLVQLGGALDPVSSVRLVLPVADVLAALHVAGSVHGGVTPAAIEVLALDEGRARLALAGVRDGDLAYQLPERLEEGAPSAQDDVRGLLGCLYFAVTGEAPFQAESAGALARRVLGGRPLPIRTTTAPEQALQQIIERGFSRAAARRHPDVMTLRDELRAWLRAHGGIEASTAESAPEPSPVVAPAPASDASEAPPAAPVATDGATAVEREPSAAATRPEPERRAPGERLAAPEKVAPRSSDRHLLVAFAAGGVLVAALGGLLRQRLSHVQPASLTAAESAAPAVGGGSAGPSSSGPTTRSGAPSASARERALPASPQPSASASPPADLDACVAAWFPPLSFDPDTDLSFLCSEHDGRRGAARLRRAIVAAGKGKAVTPAMLEWTKLGWFEFPVYATLRARCCADAPPIEVPHLAGSICAPPRDPIHALGLAAATGGDLAGAIRAYRKAVSCLVEVGDFPAYGREGPIGGGEEPAFRAFAERGPKR